MEKKVKLIMHALENRFVGMAKRLVMVGVMGYACAYQPV